MCWLLLTLSMLEQESLQDLQEQLGLTHLLQVHPVLTPLNGTTHAYSFATEGTAQHFISWIQELVQDSSVDNNNCVHCLFAH
jgi:hypothetical protein